MNIGQYLPSAQFGLMASALALSGGLVLAAQYATSRYAPASTIASADPSSQNADWKAELELIQQTSGVALPEAPSQELVGQLLEEAKTSNLTSSVARTLLVNLSAAKAQGLGDDVPTQEKIVADAAAQLQPTERAVVYTAASLATIPQTKDSLRTYGNALAATLTSHPKANPDETLLAMGYATDYHDASRLKGFGAAQAAYEALAKELARLPVPASLAPLHVQLTNDLSIMAATYPDMAAVLEDPLRGLGGLQRYHTTNGEGVRVLTTIAENLYKNGILFSKDEPGSTLSALFGGLSVQ